VYQLELADGRTVRCGANHLWEVICANNHFKHKVFKTHDLLNNGLFNEVTVDVKDTILINIIYLRLARLHILKNNKIYRHIL